MREKILDTASKMYAEHGYTAVSMRDVASAVGVTPANLYHHFKDKEHLVREALTHVFAEKTGPIEAIVNSGATPTAKLGAFVTWFVRATMDDKVFVRLLTRELLDADEERLAYLSESVLKQPFALLTDLVEQYGIREDRGLTAASVIALILGHVHLSAALPHLTPDSTGQADAEAVAHHVLALLQPALDHHSANGRL